MPIRDDIPAEIRRAACAFHEAGHIVVGWAQGRFISHAWLKPPYGFSGETCFEPYERAFRRDLAEDRARAEAEIAILYAGHGGEMLYWNEEGLRFYPGAIASHEDDLRQIAGFLAWLGPVDEAATRARCEAAATAILYRPAIRRGHAAIARRLLDQRRIHRDEVERIMAD
ncbi:hypothetical protein [Bosea sp. (in: a-proteobacteria)]|uniref:hypothetical protein n=1 Tax=Bosea sp. (in: a-proteobacteria) TaxID=1871050 RepID=UPI003B3AA01D